MLSRHLQFVAETDQLHAINLYWISRILARMQSQIVDAHQDSNLRSALNIENQLKDKILYSTNDPAYYIQRS